MKLSDVKAQIDAYFAKANPMDIVARFKKLGYEFEVIEDDYNVHLTEFVEQHDFVNWLSFPPMIKNISNDFEIAKINSIYNYQKPFEETPNTQYLMAA